VETKRTLGFIGSLLLIVGVFMPIIRIPIVGYLDYFQGGRGDGVLVLLLGVLSLILILLGRYGGLWFTGVISLLTMGITLINFHSNTVLLRKRMESELADNPFRGLAIAALDSIHLQWGWLVMFVGVGLLLASAAIPSRNFSIRNKVGLSGFRR